MDRTDRTGRTLGVRRRGITLVEVMVVVAVVAGLAGLLVAGGGRLRQHSRRVSDLSALRQLTAASHAYANDHEGYLPPGRRENWAHDDYVSMSYRAWAALRDRYGAGADRCADLPPSWLDDRIGKPLPGNGYRDTYLGWVYWGGRQDIWSSCDSGLCPTAPPVSPELATTPPTLVSPKRVQDPVSPRATLWTCLAFNSLGMADDNGQPWPSYAPHVAGGGRVYPGGTAYWPAPEGMAVGRLDGSAEFVAWPELVPIREFFIHYHAP